MSKLTVFIPEEQDKNSYFDEVINNSQNQYIFGSVNDYRDSYDIVNIHWPEKLFNWKYPSNESILDIENKLLFWKEKSILVYTFHDYYSHYDSKNNFTQLHNLIHKHADAVIHLGKYSLKKYKGLFSNKSIHKTIYHPLYKSLLLEKEDEKYKSKLVELKNKDTVVMLVVGNVRSNEERSLIIKAFKQIKTKDKLLVVSRMYYSIKKPEFLPHRFAVLYRKLIKRYFNFKIKGEKYMLDNHFLSTREIVSSLKESSFLFIPRLHNLNSGNLFLGLTFNKIVVSPGIGNIHEVSKMIEFPSYKVGNTKSLKESIKKALILGKEYDFDKLQYQDLILKLDPKNIGQEYDDFYTKVINSKNA